LRPIFETDMIELFEKFIKSDLKAEDEENIQLSFKALNENFEDLSKFQVVSNKLMNFVKDVKDLDELKSDCPLIHFLICQSC
jgi:hypothetical protein